MKQLAVKKIFSYFVATSEEIEANAHDEKLEEFDNELKQLTQKFGIQLACSHTAFFGIEKYAITNCSKCGQLMINRDKNPTGFDGIELTAELEYVIHDGGEYDGRVLCEDCLPLTHRWGYHS
ncbi:MAG: hypothetical protein C0622_12800 [Desulfuromonas sp.]|nr:MAG: hypothetical protein C0622_12800 [Desulfuromonas sp.]